MPGDDSIRHPVHDLLGRLAAEREQAYQSYNTALTKLDLAIQALPAWPAPPPPPDDSQVGRLSESWNILPAEKPAMLRGFRGRLLDVVWGMVEPALKQQVAFNAALVDHLTRHGRAQQEAQRAIAQLAPAVREGFEGLVRFESLLLQFLQQITPLIDTKERALHEAVAELRTIAEVSQRSSAMARREIERLAGAPAPPKPGEGAPAPPKRSEGAATDAYKYVGFEDRFRGSEQEIRARLASYVPCFEGASDVLDLGCGRGEFLDLLKAKGVKGTGLDLNPEMVEVCRSRGLEATAGDALDYLSGLADESLGGLLAVQVVEHLEPDYLIRLLQTAFYKLRPGSRLVLETINPACWVAFFESYLRDLTHARPLHPQTLQYLVQASGFTEAEIVYRSPVADKLQGVTPRPVHYGAGSDASDPLTELVTAFNCNVERLNERIFSHLDYAVIARRP